MCNDYLNDVQVRHISATMLVSVLHSKVKQRDFNNITWNKKRTIMQQISTKLYYYVLYYKRFDLWFWLN